jgi:predicted nucleic acid-binding protein
MVRVILEFQPTFPHAMNYMTVLLFADTNLLVYPLDPANRRKQIRAASLIDRGMAAGVLITSPQSLNECYRVLTEKKKLVPRQEARDFILTLFPTCRASLDKTTIELAWKAETLTGYSWWDCLLLAAALLAGCDFFLSEDLADGHVIEGMRVLNPFIHDVQRMIP